MRNRLSSFILFSIAGLQLFLTANVGHCQSDWDAIGSDRKAIQRVLDTQQKAWNRHDIEGFMAGYWNSSQLTFFSGADERDGWQATMERYLETYGAPGRHMGTLEFSGVRIEVLGQEAAFVRGTWHLTMPDGKTPHGLFTLIFRKFPEGWKIVHDHTSTAE